MTFVQLSLAPLLFLTLWSYRQEGAYAAPESSPPSGQRRSTDPWTAAGLTKDLSLGDAPAGLLKVDYGKDSVTINGSLTPEQASSAPKVALAGAINCTPPFALVMLDPDAPSRSGATERSWLHWMVVNAKSTTKLHEGEQLMPYEGPTPPRGTGPHRYVFLAYCQGGTSSNSAKLKPTHRNKFQLKDFRKKLGGMVPFAGTFFYAENTAKTKGTAP
ncbi:protein D1-like [Dermacentor albipictus]|uniref:protein D1-like n=1 Tax=Dermacentor albipictus TaxID=60249 RepID=UPI0031FD2A2D